MDIDALVATFAPDGIVHDQGKEMHQLGAGSIYRPELTGLAVNGGTPPCR